MIIYTKSCLPFDFAGPINRICVFSSLPKFNAIDEEFIVSDFY